MKEIKYWGATNVESTEYIQENKYLIVEYTNRKRYLYDPVPIEVWKQLIEAKSIGQFLYAEIKGKYGYVDVTGLTI